jgi:hypothetical protein
MGFLDDAIREHLELRRRRGADPSEVAHEERAALGPAGGDGDVQHAQALVDAWGSSSPGAVITTYNTGSTPKLGRPMSEETAELDMQAILGAEADEKWVTHLPS